MEFVTRKNATLPILKMQIVKDGRDSYEDFMSFIETSTIYFSMQNIETGVMKINTKFAGFVEKIFDDPNAKPEYYVYYKFTKNETNKPGRYEGQFLFKNEQGSLILPIREKLLITIKDSLLEDDLDYNECFTGKFQCCVIGPPGPLLPTELTLSATYSSGSIVADYTLTANQGVDARTSISFTNTLGTITGDSIQIVTGVTISRGQTTSGSSVTVDGDFSNLDFTSFFSNISVSPSTINLDTELLVSENFGDALSANCYCYLFTNTSTKSATLKFEPCSGGKVTSILGPLQSAYQCIKKYGYSISSSVTATLQQQCNFPDYECGPPPSATPTPTPTQTPTQTPTPTITPTITLTMTRTPTVTPTQTLLPFISGCPIFFASKFNSNLYQYNLVSNTLTYINLSNDSFCLEAAASGIANKFYELISDGGVSQYPVVRYWNWDYETRTIYSGPIDAEVPNSTYNGEIGLGLAPTLDGEKVYISQYGWNSNSNIQTVLLFDLTGTTELFDLVENRYVIDMTRNSTDSLFLLTRGSSQIWIEQWETDDTSAGSSKIFEFPVFSNSQTEESSIFVDSGNLYMLQYGYPDHAVYQISNIPPYEITYINGFSIVPQVIAGAAAFPECSVFDFTKLIVNIQSVYSVNSSSVTYNLTFNYPINEDLTIGFTDTIGVYSGSPIVVTTGVTVSASAITGTTTVVIDVDFNNLSHVSTFSGYSFTPYYYSGAVTITDTDVFPTPTPTVTKTKTPTPTITKTVTKTPTLTPTPTFNCFCYSVTNNISGTSEIAYLTCSGEEGFFYLNTLGETVKLCVVQNGIAVALGSATISLEGSCLDGFCPTPTPTPTNTKTPTITPSVTPEAVTATTYVYNIATGCTCDSTVIYSDNSNFNSNPNVYSNINLTTPYPNGVVYYNGGEYIINSGVVTPGGTMCTFPYCLPDICDSYTNYEIFNHSYNSLEITFTFNSCSGFTITAPPLTLVYVNSNTEPVTTPILPTPTPTITPTRTATPTRTPTVTPTISPSNFPDCECITLYTYGIAASYSALTCNGDSTGIGGVPPESSINGCYRKNTFVVLSSEEFVLVITGNTCRVTGECSPPPRPTRTQTPTASITPSITPTRSLTPSITPTRSLTPSITPTRSLTPSITPTITVSNTQNFILSTPTPTASPSSLICPYQVGYFNTTGNVMRFDFNEYNALIYVATTGGTEVYDTSYSYIETIPNSLSGGTPSFASVAFVNELIYVGGDTGNKSIDVYDTINLTGATISVGNSVLEMSVDRTESFVGFILDNTQYKQISVPTQSINATLNVSATTNGDIAWSRLNDKFWVVSTGDTIVYVDATAKDIFGTDTIPMGGYSGYGKRLLDDVTNSYTYLLVDGQILFVYDGESSVLIDFDLTTYSGTNTSMTIDVNNNKLYILNVVGNVFGLIKIDISTLTDEGLTVLDTYVGYTNGEIIYDLNNFEILLSLKPFDNVIYRFCT